MLEKIKENKILKYILNHMLLLGFIFITLGFLFSLGLKEIFYFNITSISDTDYFKYFLNLLLAVGLYTGVYGIDKKEFRENKKIILKVVTLGVILKSIFIGSIFYYLTGNILGFLLGIAIAQIDPLSVSHLIGKKKRLSTKAETIFRSWSSFDGPMVIILSLYIILPLLNNIGISSIELFKIILTLFLSFFIYKYRYQSNIFFDKTNISKSIFLLIIIILSAYFEMFLLIALIALFIRPKFGKSIDYITTIAFYISIFVLGMFLVNGVDIKSGILLGVLVFISQILVTFLLGKTFSFKDKMYLSFGQQNGITSIILALFLEKYFPGQIVSTIGIAILTITILYFISNYILDKRFNK